MSSALVPIIFGMSEPVLHRIEDELSDGWLERWLEAGLEKIEAYLAKQAAFLDYLEAADSAT
jgi:hypothetical protein